MRTLTKAAVQGTTCGLAIGVVLLVGGRVWQPAGVAAQDDSVAEVMRAKKFELVDGKGQVRAELATFSDGAKLRFLDETRVVRSWLNQHSVTIEGVVLPGMSHKPPRGRLDSHGLTVADDTTLLVDIRVSDFGGDPDITLKDRSGKVTWQSP